MPMAMNSIDVLVVPSRQEGFGTVILEARACGARVVGTNVGGITEAVEDQGIVVQDYEAFEPEIAKAIVDLLCNTSCGHYSNEFELKWSWQSNVVNEVETYTQIFKERSSND